MLVRANAAGTAQPAGDGNRLALGRNLHRPSTKERARVIGIRKPERNVEVALRVKLGAECILMVIAIAPYVGNRYKPVCLAVAVGVQHAGQLCAVCYVQSALVAFVVLPISQTENLIQALREFLELRLRLFVVHAIHEKDVTTPRAYCQPVVRHQLKRSCLNHLSLWQWHAYHAVKLAFPLLSAPSLAHFLCARAHGQQQRQRAGQSDISATSHNEFRPPIFPWAVSVSEQAPVCRPRHVTTPCLPAPTSSLRL